jgi:acetoin:2,6-dichlorophenolindophenol oxidoreductase subunit beta
VAELTYREAVARGIAQEMARDPDVIFFGEDVAKAGGVFKAFTNSSGQSGCATLQSPSRPSWAPPWVPP